MSLKLGQARHDFHLLKVGYCHKPFRVKVLVIAAANAPTRTTHVMATSLEAENVQDMRMLTSNFQRVFWKSVPCRPRALLADHARKQQNQLSASTYGKSDQFSFINAKELHIFAFSVPE